jgi:hypothetical protein
MKDIPGIIHRALTFGVSWTSSCVALGCSGSASGTRQQFAVCSFTGYPGTMSGIQSVIMHSHDSEPRVPCLKVAVASDLPANQVCSCSSPLSPECQPKPFHPTSSDRPFSTWREWAVTTKRWFVRISDGFRIPGGAKLAHEPATNAELGHPSSHIILGLLSAQSRDDLWPA